MDHRNRMLSLTRQESLSLSGYDDGQWCINDISGCKNGTVFIRGETTKRKFYIISVNLNTELVTNKTLKLSDSPYESAWCYCDSLSDYRVATVRCHHEIGIFNILDNSYKEKSIYDIVSGHTSDMSLSCVAADALRSLIIVGLENSRNVYVFDDNLEYRFQMTLPEEIIWPKVMKVHGKFLLICDQVVKKAFLVSMNFDETLCERVLTFTKPDDSWWPRGVTTDVSGHIYILYSSLSSVEKCLVVKYSQSREQLLAEEVNDHVKHITTVSTEDWEKLVLTSSFTRSLFEYNLTLIV